MAQEIVSYWVWFVVENCAYVKEFKVENQR